MYYIHFCTQYMTICVFLCDRIKENYKIYWRFILPINSYEEYPLTWQPNRELLKKPIYKTLINVLQADILSNKISKNTKLPS